MSEEELVYDNVECNECKKVLKRRMVKKYSRTNIKYADENGDRWRGKKCPAGYKIFNREYMNRRNAIRRELRKLRAS